MPAPTVTVVAPPPLTYPVPGIPRPGALVRWTGGVGPFTVLHEWDTSNGFASGALIQDSNAGATSPNAGVPPSDMGPAGTPWFYRVRVTDTSDGTSTLSGTFTLAFVDPIDFRRYLYLFENVGVAFDPTDTTTPGPDDDDYAADGFTIDFRRYLYLFENVGVAFDPTDTTTPGPDDDDYAADGFTIDFRRYLYLLASAGVGFDPIDTPGAGWDAAGTGSGLVGPGDGYAISFRRYLYLLANVDTTTPTPHIWYVFPSFGREGWEFQVVGYGFGDSQAEYTGGVTLDGLAVTIISWELVAEAGADMAIDPTFNIAEPIHQLIRATVPSGGTSGLIVVCTDGP